MDIAKITFYENVRTTPNLVGLQLAGCNVMNDAGVYRKFYPESQDIQVEFFLGAIFLGSDVVPSPKIVINLPMTYEKVLCKAEPNRFRG